jgi:nucleoside-diphosphate-sugar epimerase
MSSILVTGGNGFVGRHIVAVLQDRGETVRVLALPAEDTRWLGQHGIAVCRGDVRQPEAVATAMRGVDAVLHLAAMMDVWRPMRDYHAVNVTGTENVCRAALAEGVRRVVHMSSSSVYGMGLGRPADESFPLAPFPDPYPVTKADGDSLVQRMIAEDHLPGVIVRPDQIFGPRDHLHFGRMAERLRAGKSVVVGPGDNAMPFVYVTDAVQGLLLALYHPRAVGQAFNITNDKPLTQQQILETIAREIGASPPRGHVPYRALYTAAYLAERFAALRPSGHRPPITRLGVTFFGTDNRYAIGKARRELGFRPMTSVQEGIRLAALWYLLGERSQRARVPAAPGPAKGGDPR